MTGAHASGAPGSGAHDRLLRWFARFPDFAGPAYLHDDGDLGYRALAASAAALARTLSEEDANGDDRTPVIVYGHKDRRVLVAYWACLLAGRPAVCVEPDWPLERLARIGEATQARILLLADAVAPRVSALAIVPVPIGEPAPGATAAAPSPAGIRDDDPAYILFSSGTTGAPKGIAVSYANLADFVDWTRTLAQDYGPIGCVSGNVRHCFDVSLFETWLAWTTGAPISALDHRDVWNVQRYVARFAAHGLTTWVSTPALAAHYVKHARFTQARLPTLQTMLFCGEVLSKNLVRALRERFPGVRIVNTYGPTECTVAVTAVEITSAHLEAPSSLPIGWARPGTRLVLLGDAGAPTGEIAITGRSVGLGYVGAPEKQAAHFPSPDVYRTGDHGRADATGLWYFEGRRDREVKIQGFRIDLNEVEACIRDCAGVGDVLVAPDEAALGLCAYVLGPASPDALARLAATVGRMLPPHAVPKIWYGGEVAALNANSKVDRERLRIDLPAAGARYRHAPGAARDVVQDTAR